MRIVALLLILLHNCICLAQSPQVNNLHFNRLSIKNGLPEDGNDIPQNIINKIFQPFFTTKPTGQRTGLGFSLAYDIITNEHNGTIKVESKEDERSMLIIQLPITA